MFGRMVLRAELLAEIKQKQLDKRKFLPAAMVLASPLLLRELAASLCPWPTEDQPNHVRAPGVSHQWPRGTCLSHELESDFWLASCHEKLTAQGGEKAESYPQLLHHVDMGKMLEWRGRTGLKTPC